MVFPFQLANVAYFQTQLFQKSLHCKVGKHFRVENRLRCYRIIFLNLYLTIVRWEKKPGNAALTDSSITASNPLMSAISRALGGHRRNRKVPWSFLNCARCSIIWGKTFTFTAARRGGRTLPAHRGLHGTNVSDNGKTHMKLQHLTFTLGCGRSADCTLPEINWPLKKKKEQRVVCCCCQSF